MDLFEKIKRQRTIYDCQDGWYVETYNHCWCVVLIINGTIQRSKKIVKVKGKGVNYFDRACEVADKRNKQDYYRFEKDTYCHITKIKKD